MIFQRKTGFFDKKSYYAKKIKVILRNFTKHLQKNKTISKKSDGSLSIDSMHDIPQKIFMI